MLENIAIIASIICGITAVTTSLRAIGASREFARHERDERIKTSCRIGTVSEPTHPSQRSSLRLHLLVTLIWYVLAVLCVLPLITGKSGAGRVLWALPYGALGILIWSIWRKAVRK